MKFMCYFFILYCEKYSYIVHFTMKLIYQDTKKTNLALIEEACEISLSKAGQTIVQILPLTRTLSL